MARVVWNGKEVEGEVKKAVMDVLKVAGFEGQRVAKQKCRVDTGRLRASISTTWSGGSSRGDLEDAGRTFTSKKSGNSQTLKSSDAVGNPGGDEDNFKVVTGTNVEYGPHVEFNIESYLQPGFEMAIKSLKNNISKLNL